MIWKMDALPYYAVRTIKLGKTTEEMYPSLTEANVLVIDDLMYRHWDRWSDASYEHVGITYMPADLTPNFYTGMILWKVRCLILH